MERDEVLELMRRKAVELLDVDAEAVRPELSFVADLHVDSLSLAEYVMELEDELGVELREDELPHRTTVGAFCDVLLAKMGPA